MLYIFSPNEQLLTILRPEGPDTPGIGGQQLTQHAGQFIGYEGDDEPPRPGACPYFDGIHTEQINRLNTLVLSVPGDHPDAEYVVEDNLVAMRDLDGEYLLFEIKRINDNHETTNIKTAYCELAALELLDDHIEDVRPTNCGAEFALMQALTGTRWESGTVHSFGTKSTRFFRINPIAAINKILTTWGGEVRFRVAMSDTGQITGRYVDILAQRGNNNGKRYEHAKDIEGIERTVDISGIKTALYGYGRGEETGDGFGRRITFEDIEWSISAGDPADKPLGQKWVGDSEALETWGRASGTRHRVGQYENPDMDDAEELLQLTWLELQRRKQPLINYTLQVAVLEHIAGYEHEAVRLGDTVAVIDRVIRPAIAVSARVIEYKRYLNEPHKSQVILGNFLPSITDDGAKLRAVQTTLHDRSGIWNEKITAGRSYKSVYIDGDSGLRVLDESNMERVALGEYSPGKYGLKLTSKDGLRTVLDEDGVLDAYQVNLADNLSPGKPLTMRVYVPEGVSRIDSMNLVAFTDRFRAYQIGMLEAGAESYYAESDTQIIPLQYLQESIVASIKVPTVEYPYAWHANEIFITVENATANDISLRVGSFIGTTPFGGSGLVVWGNQFFGHSPISFAPYEKRVFRIFRSHISPNHSYSVFTDSNQEFNNHYLFVSVYNYTGYTQVKVSSSITVQTKHMHAPQYAIHEDALPVDVNVLVDGINRTVELGGPWGDANSPVDIGPLDLAPFIQSPGWHVIEFLSSSLGRITAALTCQQFIQTV